MTAQSKYREQTVSYVDIDRFMGKWYVIASIPTWFEKGATNAIENYRKNPDGTIHVRFTYHKDHPEGSLKKMTQKAYVIDQETKAHWKIRPLWPFLFDYLVIDLEESEYQYTMIGRPNKANLWIMARTPSLPDAVYQKLIKKAGDAGYDISEIEKVPQSW